MNSNNYQLQDYRKFLLNRNSVTNQFTQFVENCLSSEDEAAKHSFHKIMVHGWSDTSEELFENLNEYLTCIFIPTHYNCHAGIASFYTNNLQVIMKLIKLDFLFPYKRNMYNIDILFNDKTSADCFGYRQTLEEIISSIVSNRFSDKFELDLSNFCEDKEFTEKQIRFYKLSLLAVFKILMIRMGRDTKTLNLSNNNLTVIPPEITNFFIKGELTAVNLSNNNIQSMGDLRLISRIEKLWLEGNPLCDSEEMISYVKQLTVKFPRLKELDGVPVNQFGVIFPFWKNYLVDANRKSKMLAEKFLTLYFSHYDSSPRKIHDFYDANATLTINTDFTDAQELKLPQYAMHSRNILHPLKRTYVQAGHRRHSKKAVVVAALNSLPETTHDPKSFCVDVLKNDKKALIIVVDGVFKERNFEISGPDRYFRFRRTFVFLPYVKEHSGPSPIMYCIRHEMFSIAYASQEQIDNSFKIPTRNLNSLSLLSPEKEEIESVCTIFMHITNLKKHEVDLRLRIHNWDLRKALLSFSDELRNNKISADRFNDEVSDLSSIDDDDLVD